MITNSLPRIKKNYKQLLIHLLNVFNEIIFNTINLAKTFYNVKTKHNVKQ